MPSIFSRMHVLRMNENKITSKHENFFYIPKASARTKGQ